MSDALKKGTNIHLKIEKLLKEETQKPKPIKLDTILLRKIRACIAGSIHSISEGGAGVFHVVVTRNNPTKIFFRYTIEVKPDTGKGGQKGYNRP